jgi:DNA-binding MarR family transcriptional regulator
MSPAREYQIHKGLVTSHQVYNVVSRYPGESVYSYAKRLGFSTGRTQAAVRRLEEEGLVTTRLIRENLRVRRIVTPVPAADLIRSFIRPDP